MCKIRALTLYLPPATHLLVVVVAVVGGGGGGGALDGCDSIRLSVVLWSSRSGVCILFISLVSGVTRRDCEDSN